MFVFLASISNWALKVTGRPPASLPFNMMVWLPSRDSRATPANPYHVLRDWSGLKKTFFPIVAPLSAERASADVTVNRHGEPLSMTFGPIVTFNPFGAGGDNSSANSDGAFSIATGEALVAEALGGSDILAGEAAACAACCVAAGAVLSLEQVASSDAAVRMTVMLFENFISNPFFIANREKL
jgi:hypothetical protein